MAIHLDPTRLRAERLRRGWSQDQLAAISGVSLRTIQRLEAGRAAAPASLSALARAMALTESRLLRPDGCVRRATPLTIAHDIGPARRLYASLGLTVIETNDPGCIGMQAGNTCMILCSVAFMKADYPATDFQPLAGRTIPYLWVRSLISAKAAYATVVEEVLTRNGTHEALVEHQGQWAILAETVS